MVTLVSLFSTTLREMKELMYEFEEPFAVDHSRFEAHFGPAEVTAHRDAIAATVEWYRRHRG